MKPSTHFILVSLLGFLGFQTVCSAQKFKIEILQDGELVEIIDESVELEKKEFQIRVTLKKQEGVFMNASFQKNYYTLKPSDPIKDYEYLDLKTMAEVEFNGDQELFIHDEYFNYLFYNRAKDWHRFDKELVFKGKKVIGTKTVQNLWEVNNKETTKLKDVQKDIYLFFVAPNDRSKEKVPKELGRYKIHVKWKRF